MLLHIPQVLDADELAQARALLADAEWVDGRRTAGPQAATVKHNQQLPPGCAAAQALQALVLAALDRHPLLFSAALPKRVLPPMFNRYGGEANHYGDHVDQAIRHIPGGPQAGQRVRTDLSCTLFLADPAEYDGGELVISDLTLGSLDSPRIKLPAGDAVLYPGTSVHRVEPVTRGQRLASFFWIESLVRSDEQRRLLFEMDLALMKLRQRDGESAEAVSLTGIYHNLLRLWADT
ncbi:MAG: Fe2+-dependent dioxygenase [Burkholderiaceae bacterium]|nr:Fe2+-dependent dioxygenase [Burkholderiaceae bacterium]